MRTVILALALCIPAAALSQPQPPLPYQSKDKNIGVVNCSSSLCHGSVTTWKDSNILQNEYVTWSRVDKHHNKAYQVLLNDRSKRIAKNLGLKEPAHEAKVCIDCHGYFPPVEARGERFKVSDGVSCEACHGPAERWVKSHTAPKATHQENIANGLYPLSDPVAQAKLCLSCHFGNSDKFVTHRIMGAGHPRITFELDTFTQTQPPHFVVDEDWQRRKGQWDPVRVWAIGQALAAQELIDVLLDPKRSRDGLFPELVVFDCHSCHHSMQDIRWTPRLGIGPGRIRLNDANLLMVKQIVRRTFPGDEKNYNELVSTLHRAVGGEGGDALDAARKLRAGLDLVIKKLATRNFTSEDLRGILAGLIDDGLNGQYSDYQGAEQATMAMGSVMNFLAKRGELRVGLGEANRALDRLHDAVKDDEKYQPQRFRAALAELQKTVSR